MKCLNTISLICAFVFLVYAVHGEETKLCGLSGEFVKPCFPYTKNSKETWITCRHGKNKHSWIKYECDEVNKKFAKCPKMDHRRSCQGKLVCKEKC